MPFNHIKLQELEFNLKSITTESGRLYQTPNGNLYPSVTTVLSAYNKKSIYEWRQKVGEEEANKISGRASRRGTSLHTVCEKYLLNESHNMMPDTKELFLKIKPDLDENVKNVYALEQSLYSDKLKIAGRVDCIADWAGELSVIDFKSSTYEKDENKILNYFMQCTAYAMMFEEITNKPVSQIVVLIAVENGTNQVFVRDRTKYETNLFHYLSEYDRNNKGD
jgi:genome maintenance exonuclease 1